MSRPPSAESAFRAIAHPLRRRILEILRTDERAAGELFQVCRVTRPTLSIHLRVLRASNLVLVRRRGTSLRYRLNRPAMNVLLEWTSRFRDTR